MNKSNWDNAGSVTARFAPEDRFDMANRLRVDWRSDVSFDVKIHGVSSAEIRHPGRPGYPAKHPRVRVRNSLFLPHATQEIERSNAPADY